MSQSRPRSGAAAALALTAALTLSACRSDDLPGASALAGDGPSASASAEVPALRLVTSVQKGATDVAVDRELAVEARGGSIDSVSVSSPAGKVPGQVRADGTRWVASGRLEPGTSYTMTTVAAKTDGTRVSRTTRFRTQDLTLDEQTYPSVAPLAGETVGVGMPVIVSFDLPVSDKASFEKHMQVTSAPSQPGAWHWISDTEAHWRPKAYWKAGTDVHVDIDVNSVSAGHGIYGQESRELDFHVGDAHIYRVDAQTHQLKVFSNGKLLRTLPTTTGKPGFTTRSGVKVIIEKFPVKRMNSETIGIPAGSSEAYDIDDVQWAMRVTYSGEFIHAAPWSVGSQGYANVSHGCTGLSTANAAWLYAMSRRGDVVEYTGTDKPMTLTNGYGDWNESFQQYRQGSALS
ncbi:MULTISPECIES: Ig-like domain-containing protein [unclassified Nocardioides]|uniref:L,D-transpeptidase n=1 Tax=unclassified Nocardioides TaxID=2615069 RepID=UPI000056FF90|nr:MULTISPECIES: Ig-like domain-containing protein [unclassified Nocardioides]ABL82640.1 ErfK/YbiS/YcfS/YnhG family protein [Nocardioides sp. JS614]